MIVDASRIRRVRAERGWTQADLAELMEVSVRTIQRVEATGRISSDALSAFCAVAGEDRCALLAPPKTGAMPSEPHMGPTMRGAHWWGATFGFAAGLACGLLFALLF